ncbi:probable aspartic protease At2g35615 [Abrus precatorius]|uniref:Probable aspartic protease At2g35615 n=1 Tax=Abrus precatorius TaxID=3816 RepID=A0A8B8KJF4_ABRPR|nr:probable aspartic protease At2g35615 [Abrus precatorius]
MHAFVLFFVALSPFSVISFVEANKGLSFSVDLIHRDSPLSPFYNPSLTLSERIKIAALRSVSRSNQIGIALLNENKLPESILIPDHGEYLMKFYIGTPPVEKFAIVDTGSDLIWIQCSPCEKCFSQDTPLFEPSKSSTFSSLSCDSQPCTILPEGQHACSDSGECIYAYQYGDKSFTAGILGTESITFDSSGGANTIAFPKSIFGCGMYNNFTTIDEDGKLTGLVGLGAGPLSLVSQIGDQIGHKFSYCLVPFTSNSTSKLKFGNGAIINGDGVVSTPLIIKPILPTFYFLNLEGITIGQKTIQTGRTDGNIIIDSGTVMTYLEPSFYNNFVTSLQEVLSVEVVQDLPFPLNFCFPYQDEMYFPDIAFQFTGAIVSLRPKNTLFWLDDNNILCLAIAPSPATGISIFGNLAQIDFQVEYDLEGKKVSFAPTDCTNN